MEGGFDPDCRRCMPWNEIESGTYDERINAVRTLIRLRKTKKACKSEKIIWQNTGHARVIGYRKEMEGEPAVEVRLNASKEKVKLPECREMLFSYGVENGWLMPDGVCIFSV